MSFVLTLLVILAVAWAVGNLAGYAVTRKELPYNKFNWRIFAGSSSYINWAYDQAEQVNH
jgi:hypothetical protein